MRQKGWLEFANGVCHLVLVDNDYPLRSWSDRDSALAEVASEGWLLLGPFPRRYRRSCVLDRTDSLVRLVTKQASMVFPEPGGPMGIML